MMLQWTMPLGHKSTSLYLLGLVVNALVRVAAVTGYPYSIADQTICQLPPSGVDDCYPLVFVPSEVFQAIRPGQQVPKGLHIRMNFETGVKEAKLLAPHDPPLTEEELISVTLSEDAGSVEVDMTHSLYDSSNEDMFALDGKSKDIILKEVPETTAAQPSIPNRLIAGKDKIAPEYERPAGLKGSKAQAFDQTLLELKSSTNQITVNLILDHLDYVVHQIDYGINFAKSDIAIPILVDLMRGEDPHIRERAAEIVGNALSNNPKAQELASRFGLTMDLWTLFENQTLLILQKRFLFAFGAMIRSNPTALALFADSQGSDGFLKMAVYCATDSLSMKMRERIMTLFSDLVDPDMISIPEPSESVQGQSASNLGIGRASPEAISLWCRLCESEVEDEESLDYKESRIRALELLRKQNICPT
ncbi:hypothetical protein BASA81_018581 [Batrachochytrium salamandrivorans]|nr:hypothetical protein BASA81_018581 [Batrachochytrium salamandrivorans]